MSRINTNIASMNAITRLSANNEDLSVRLQRLSSGLRINAGKDDPAGLIASENLRSEISGINAGIDNSIRASSVIATAEGALNEISALLIDIKGLLVTTANKGALSTEEIDANQLQVDSAINSISRIANATEFQGKKLLNGNLNYTL
jgi:flagellin